jgi:hypothetical protein
MKVLFLPLDDRPVTYIYPQLVAKAAGIVPIVPPRTLFGSLSASAKVESLISWIDAAIARERPSALLLCLDTLLYGGLIDSRRSSDSFKTIFDKLCVLKTWSKSAGPLAPIYGQASIMRISDNYDATEEKQYWTRFGREIFAWSSQLHRLLRGDELPAGVLAAAEYRIPPDIRRDYTDTRFRNFQINSKLIDFVSGHTISRLVFSLDDSGETGLNILERDKLLQQVRDNNLTRSVACYAGADEVLCALFAHWLVDVKSQRPKANLSYTSEEARQCQSLYEGQTIAETIAAQLSGCGIDLSPDANPDFHIIVHAAHRQGDHIHLPGHADLRQVDTSAAVRSTLKILDESAAPCVLIDAAYANGADPALIDALLKRQDLLNKLISYAGWNTTGNASGSALALAVAYWARAVGGGRDEALSECLFTRLVDDWAYQSCVRGTITTETSTAQLASLMTPYVSRIAEAMNYQPKALTLSFPWNRTFEIEVGIDTRLAGVTP